MRSQLLLSPIFVVGDHREKRHEKGRLAVRIHGKTAIFLADVIFDVQFATFKAQSSKYRAFP